jgi:hypothetical protein
VYALLGIPLNAILIGSLGRVWKEWAQTLILRMWRSIEWTGTDLDSKPRVLLAIVESMFFFTLFFVIFHPIPALVFAALENDGVSFSEGSWSFLDSLYYTFVTLSTIGFGDMVPGNGPKRQARLIYLITTQQVVAGTQYKCRVAKGLFNYLECRYYLPSGENGK